MRRLTARAVPYELPGYPAYLAALLHARGITTKEQADAFLNPGVHQLHDAFLLQGMDRACELIHKASKEKRIAAVYGDYDADGVCASAIMLSALEALGIQAFPYIPARLSEGYGLNAEAITALAAQASLLISVDCGITADHEVRLARELGMTVILTDHHTLPETLPMADAIIHPQLGQYPEPALCGAGVAWKLACALLGLEKAQDSLDLAALATVADLVPLKGENRVIVSLGLKALARTARPGLRALMRVSGIKEGAALNAEHVAYQLAPRLNAGGRLATAQEALQLLLTQDLAEAERLAGMLDGLNRERREIEQQVLKEAAALVAGIDLSQRRSLVIFGTDWNPGVVGLTAGKLAERWNYPAIVLTRNGEEISGSGRSAGEVDLYAAIKACEDLLSRFGGHRMAAGLALPPENLEAFVRQFDLAVREQLGQEDLVPETVYDTTLPLNEVSLKTVGLLEQLAPFGLGNPSPLFLLEDVGLVSARAVGSSQAHLKLTVAQGGAVREGIAFGLGRMLPSLGRQVSLVSSVDENEFNGRVSAQLKVRAILPGQQAFAADEIAQARAICAALAGESDSSTAIEAISALPDMLPGTRGTLLVAYTMEAANDLHARYPLLSTYTGSATDPRAFNAIVFAPDWSAHFAPYERLVFADGLPGEKTAGIAARATGAKLVQSLPRSIGLTSLIKALTPGLEELRAIYAQMKTGQTAAFTNSLAMDLVAMLVFCELGLIELDGEGRLVRLLPMKRVDPMQSPLYRALTE